MRKLKAFLVLAGIFLLSGCPKVEAQTAVTLGPVPKAQFLDNTGAPLSGGKVFTYQAGTNTPLSTYTDSTGLIMNADPVILDAGGRANIWFQGQAYKIAVQNSGGTTIYTVDNFLVSPFLNGNNSWTGNETHSGIETFNGPLRVNAGGSLSGTFSGNPNFSGNVSINGNLNVSGTTSGNIDTDLIQGTLTNGGNMQVTGANGSGTSSGETIALTAGLGAPTAAGGGIVITGGAGGVTSGAGGNLIERAGQAGPGADGGLVGIFAGSATSGTGNGGQFSIQSGNGSGSGNGGPITISSGVGSGGGVSGNIAINSGTAQLSLGGGNIAITTNASINPTCSVSGAGDAATCTTSSTSSNSSGIIEVTPGGSGITSNIGITVILTRALGTAMPMPCMLTLNSLATGFNTGASLVQSITNSNIEFGVVVDNNTVTFASTPYWVNYFCVGN